MGRVLANPKKICLRISDKGASLRTRARPMAGDPARNRAYASRELLDFVNTEVSDQR